MFKFFKIGGKNDQIKYLDFKLSLYIFKFFFLIVLKRIFPLSDVLQLQVLKKQLYIYKTRSLDFFKNSNLRSILVACREL